VQDATQCVGVNIAHGVAIATKHRTASSFFRRRQSAPTLKRHHFQGRKCLRTAKHSRVGRPRRCSTGNLELSVSRYGLDMLVISSQLLIAND